MGVKINVQRKSDSAYEIALHKYVAPFTFHQVYICICMLFFRVAEISVKRKHYPWLKWDWIFYRTKLGSDYKSAIHTMTNFSMQVLNIFTLKDVKSNKIVIYFNLIITDKC